MPLHVKLEKEKIMSEEIEKQVEKETTETVSPAPAATKADEHMIPKTRLDEEISKRKAMEAQLKELNTLKAEKAERENAALSEAERLKKSADDATAENARLKADILRRDVIAETGLPAVFADRLKGSTKEEMLDDAKEIMKAIPQAKPAQQKVPATNPANGNTQMTDDERRSFLGLRR